MPVYLYETIPSTPGGEVRRYELQQSMKEPALTHHPGTGEPMKRIITGGFGLLRPGGTGTTPSAPSGGCGAGCGCH